MKSFYFTIATFFGVGYFPKAPGTAGSLAAILLFWLIAMSSIPLLIFLTGMFFIGVWVSMEVEKSAGSDPGIIVIDEVLGQGIALVFLPHEISYFAAAFILFRIFDIWKPFPIDQSQRLPNGWGVMTDDLLAGIYANLILQIFLFYGLF